MITDLDYLPCSNDPNAKCSTCSLHGSGCPVEQPYHVLKAVYPVKTTPNAGVNVQELVKAKYPDYYKYFNLNFDWNDLDGILDFLYFHAKILHVAEAQQVIDLIESNCEVQK